MNLKSKSLNSNLKHSPRSATVIDVHVASLRKMGYRNLEEWLRNPNHVYIGRNMPWVKGADRSKWANPFSVKKFGRDGCLDRYREWIVQQPQLMGALDELRGKVLGCWCSPSPCHGHVLIDLLQP